MRALLLVLDSVGCGAAADAAAYGDTGADTLGHIYGSIPGFCLPNLERAGLAQILRRGPAHAAGAAPLAHWGRMSERSSGKDTTTGHWELAGAVLDQPFATYTRFPDEWLDAIGQEAGCEFIGNYPQSGTVILDELGAAHLATGKLIVYTSADSVLQIAAHDAIVDAARLDAICRVARRHAEAWRIGRVISRPFTGAPGAFVRTAGRHDYAMLPPRTILNALQDGGFEVHGIGKISDIFAGSGITSSTPTASNEEGMKAIETAWAERRDGLIFANLVDFDSLYGHRRNVAGYAAALIAFDEWLGQFITMITDEDLVIITADHGNDPTHPGTDHTREQVPLLVFDDHHPRRDLGLRSTFADVAATFAHAFQLPSWPVGEAIKVW